MTARGLVTGALGNVGQEVVRACLAAGFVVRAAGASAKVHARWPTAEAVDFDFTDHATWAGALDAIDFVFPLRPPPRGDLSTTLNPFVDAAYAAKGNHLGFRSVAGVEPKT